MIRFDVEDISPQLDNLFLEEGDSLLIHNSLLGFGKPNDIGFSKLPGFFFDAIRKKLGENGTISVPAFNFDFCQGAPFNRQETPCMGMGVFSEYVRTLSGSVRSYHPMQSVSVFGKNKDYITENDTESAFGPDGPFDRLLSIDSKIMLLGADFNTVSLIHWAEEKHRVPYRYWKSFSGDYVDKGVVSQRIYKLFVRSLESNPKLKLYAIQKKLIEQKKITSVKLGGGTIAVFRMVDFISVATHCIVQNPYYFVSNHPNFEQL